MQNDVYLKKNCRLCNSKRLVKFLKLNPTPPGNHFVVKRELNKRQKKYPLELNICKNCFHIQLRHVVRGDILFKSNYSYLSGTSREFVNHLRNFSNNVIKKFSIKKNDLVVDIGSNDGTALSQFKEKSIKCLGIDPAVKPVRIAKKNGIDSICSFFTYELSNKIKRKYGKAKLIMSHNTLAHIDDLNEIVRLNVI